MTAGPIVPLVIANWKMNLTGAEARSVAERIVAGSRPLEGGVRLAVAPSFPSLHAVRSQLAGSTVTLAAQTVFEEDRGAFTGEVSPLALREAGVRWVLVGHSERRHIFGETDEQVARKTAACLRHGLVPVICVGETESERDAGHTSEVVARQMNAALASALSAGAADVVVAYEPVWAIGTGRNATPAQAEEVHSLIRSRLHERLGSGPAKTVPILYGGSVTPDNAAGLLRRGEVNGALVGGASLDPERFLAIARAAA